MPAAARPERTALSMVAGKPVSVQSPARTRLRHLVRAGARRRSASGVWAKVARRSLTIRIGGRSSGSRSSATAVSAQNRSAISSLGRSASSAAALTVRLTTSPRRNSHWAAPPTRPRNGRSSDMPGARRGGAGRRMWPLTMGRLSAGASRPGSRVPATVGGRAITTCSPGSTATEPSAKSSRVARSASKSIARRRWLKRTSAPASPSNSSAGSTKLAPSPSRAMNGRQAASPRPKVSLTTSHSRRAEASLGAVLSAATVSGSQNRSQSGSAGSSTSATVWSGPAKARRRPAR